MKRLTLTTEKTLTALFILIAVFSFTFHGCKPAPKQMATEYQFNVDQTGYDIYSDGKLIGRLNYGANPSLDSLIDKDNY